jgi:alpha-tubulin suppressor-like RCC1 family protein
MRRPTCSVFAVLALVGTSITLGLVGPSRAAASTTYGPKDASYAAYYADPSNPATWMPFCSGAGDGATYSEVEALGVPACGPTPTNGTVQIDIGPRSSLGGPSGPGFQCVEFAERYLWVRSALAPRNSTNGGALVKNYTTKYALTAVKDGAHEAPPIGAVISFAHYADFSAPDNYPGHVAVVTDESRDLGTTGKGSITVTGENQKRVPGGYTDGSSVLQVSNWQITPLETTNTHIEWFAPPAIATSVTAHLNGYCALLESQEVECWGTNQFGLLGDGGTEPASYVPVYVKGLAGVRNLVDNGGSWLVCAVLMTGRVECWGSNQSGMLGNGGTEAISDTPVTVRNVTDAQSVFTFDNGTACAILTTGHVDCWGYNAQGQLGDGGIKSSGVPVAVRGITDATSLSGEDLSTCALLRSGGVDCWGSNLLGELGNGGNEAYSYVPVAVRGITNAKGLFGYGTTYCAVLASGGVDCWGDDVGTTGNGFGGVESDVPVAIGGVTGAKSIAFASGPTEPTECALLADTNVDCWGSNSDGLLGNGADEAASTTPVRVSGLTNAVSIASSYGTGAFCVLRKTGEVACWGSESYGLLGNGSSSGSAYSPVPVAAHGLSTAVGVTRGINGFCALLKTGGVDCWGSNLTQVPRGPGNVQYSTVPVPVAGLGS